MAFLNMDVNAAASMPPAAVEAMARAASGCKASDARQIVESLRRRIAVEGGFELGRHPDACDVAFTAGANDSTKMIISAAARAFAARTLRLPHVVLGPGEHPATLDHCRELAADRLCVMTVLRDHSAEQLRASLQKSTCLVCVTAASGDTGSIVDVSALVAVAHSVGVPFHSDVSQLFGRTDFKIGKAKLDSAAISFGLFGGVSGSGALVVRRALVEGYGLGRLDSSDAPNLPALGAALAALRGAPADAERPGLAIQARRLREFVCSALAGAGKIVTPRGNALPNTILVAFPGGGADCIRAKLEAAGIIVGTPDRVPDDDRDKLVRISFAFNAELDDLQKLIDAFVA